MEGDEFKPHEEKSGEKNDVKPAEKPEEKKEESREEKPAEKHIEKPIYHTHEHSQKKSDTVEIKVPKSIKNPWFVVSVALAIIVIYLWFGGGSGGGITGGISADQAGQKLLSFYESSGAEGLTISSVDEESGLYKINFNFQGQVVPIYVSKDGQLAGSLSPLGDVLDVGTNNDGAGGTNVIGVSEDDDAIKGSIDAPVTIIEFSDYECPFCGSYFQETLPQIISEYVDTGKVKIVFRDFPLRSIHPQAQKAAEAAECVRKSAGNDQAYFEYHDILFNNQDALDVESLKGYSSELGQDISECLDSDEMAAEVQKDLSDGESYGVSGTPAFFINGRLVSGAQPFSAFKQIIDEELEKAGV